MTNTRINRIFILGLLVLILPSHIVGIGSFATFDEPWWVISGSNFYYALTHRDFANTVYDYHPAVTTTWVVTAGMLIFFPEYRGFGQGYFDVRKPLFEEFLLEHGKRTVELLRDSRLIQTALIVFLAVIAFLLLQKLVHRMAAFLAVVLAADAPFFLGHSRLLNHEGMLSMFVLVSVLAMLVYLRERKFIFLLLSSVAFGLAQLTKSPSIVVIGVVGLMLFISLFERESGRSFSARLWDRIKVMSSWLVIAAGIYIILWPGMWVAPREMLYQVYGNALSYAFQGARLDVTQELEPSSFGLNAGWSTAYGFLRAILEKSTPLTLIGLFLAVLALFLKAKDGIRQVIGYLALTAFLFMALFGFARGRDALHYVVTSFICFDLIAGLGWGYLLLLLADRFPALKNAWIQSACILSLIGIQIASGIPYYPYYMTYRNPAYGEPVRYAYGIGLEKAAEYLSSKPDAETSSAYVYAGMGTFSYFYPGGTVVFKKAYLTEPGMPSIIEGMRNADYLVVYSAYQDQVPESIAFNAVMESLQPEHVVLVNGLDYARIYRIADIPESVFETLASQ